MSDYWSIEEITTATGWSVGYIYKLASREKWRKTATRPVMYYLPDVVGRST